MTAKEPRPASHFRLVLQGVEGTGLIDQKGALSSLGGLVFPVIGAQTEVQSFSMDVAERAEQDAVDRVSAKVQALYDSLPEDERVVLGQILGQAAAYAWDATG